METTAHMTLVRQHALGSVSGRPHSACTLASRPDTMTRGCAITRRAVLCPSVYAFSSATLRTWQTHTKITDSSSCGGRGNPCLVFTRHNHNHSAVYFSFPITLALLSHMGLQNSSMQNIRLLRNGADLEEGCVYTQTHIKHACTTPHR